MSGSSSRVRLLLAFAAFAAGDVTFALPAEPSLPQLDAAVDLAFSLGYVLAGWGCFVQYRLIRD